MHRTLKQDLHLADDWRAQQRELDRFRQDFNHVRPHEALDMQTPASVYEPSLRPYPARLPEIQYPDSMEVRTTVIRPVHLWLASPAATLRLNSADLLRGTLSVCHPAPE